MLGQSMSVGSKVGYGTEGWRHGRGSGRRAERKGTGKILAR